MDLNRSYSVGDIENAAIRNLVSCRGLTSGGLAVNATTNTYTVTLGGTVQTGDVITVTIQTEAGEVEGSFEVTAVEDTLTKAATALELVVEALTGISSSSANAVLTITPTTTTEAIVVTAAVTGTDPTTTATVAQTIIGAKGIKTANTIQYLMNGHCGEKAATNNIALGGSVLPVSSFRWYLITLDATGTFVATAQADNVNILPAGPDNTAPVGAVKIATSAAVTFTPGVTGLNSTGITDSYYNLSCVPKAGYPA